MTDESRPGIFRAMVDAAARRAGFVREEKQAESLRKMVALISTASGMGGFGSSLTRSDKTYSALVDSYRSWVYTAIDRIAKSVATMKLKVYVYRAVGSGSKVVLPPVVRAEIKGMRTDAERMRYLAQKNLRREEIDDHPFLDLVSRPNSVMTRFTLWYHTMIRLELAGQCPWYIPRNRMNLPGEIWPLPITRSATIIPEISATAEIKGWRYRDGNLNSTFEAGEISFIHYPHPGSPFRGMSPLLAQTEPYDIDLFLARQQRNIFENSAIIGLNMHTKEKLSKIEAEELLEFLDMQYSGVTKAGGNLVTHSGLEAKQLSMSNRDAMIGEVGRYAREKLLTAYDVAEGNIGLVRDVNRANMEALEDSFVMNCLKPKTMLIEENVERDILSLYDQGLTADFDLPDVGNKEIEIKERESSLRTGFTTINEEREKKGLDKVPWGDKPLLPSTYAPLGEGMSRPGASPPPPPPGKERGNGLDREAGGMPPVPFTEGLSEKEWDPDLKAEAWRNFLRRTEDFEAKATEDLRRHFRRTRDAVLARLRRHGPKHLGLYAGWSRRKVQEHLARKDAAGDINVIPSEEAKRLVAAMEPIVVDTVARSGKAMQRTLGIGVSFNVNDPDTVQWIGERMEMFSREVSGTTFDAIDEIVRDGFTEGKPVSVIADELRNTFDVAERYRAPLIARTEIASAANKADLLAIRQAKVGDQLLKGWLSAQDPNVRESHQAAEVMYSSGGAPGPIPVDSLFSVGADQMESPGGGKIAGENINCRCTMIYVRAKGEEPLAPGPPSLPPPPAPPKPPRTPVRRPRKPTQPEGAGMRTPSIPCDRSSSTRSGITCIGTSADRRGKEMASFPPPICMLCKHLRGSWECAAFPEEIPEEILHSSILHTDPFPGDKGIRFEAKEGLEEEAAAHIAELRAAIDAAKSGP